MLLVSLSFRIVIDSTVRTQDKKNPTWVAGFSGLHPRVIQKRMRGTKLAPNYGDAD
jgi:hypothetical protein